MIPLADHLWQSTLFVAAAALLALALRRNRARVRHSIWLAASIKFLVPFAALVGLGNAVPWRVGPPVLETEIGVVLDAVSQPFSRSPISIGGTSSVSTAGTQVGAGLPVVIFTVWLAGLVAMLAIWYARWRRVRLAVRAAAAVEDGRVVEILRRIGGGGLPVVSSDHPLEPGVLGLFRPVLFWPRSLTARLTDDQVEAILTHELAHLHRRDNLAAIVHMAVQSVFWFHPAVWWIGARLVDERERACDEAVVERGSTPRVYAESILKTCEFYVESPLICVSGVTGSDLRKRIQQIMTSELGSALTVWRRMLLATAAIAAILGPVAAGILTSPALRAQSPVMELGGPTFEVASIKPNTSGAGVGGGTRSLPSGQYMAHNVTLRALMSNAYGSPLQPLHRDQLVGPAWIDSERFDILAKAEGNLPPGPDSPIPKMIRNLLADRFRLVVHTEARQLPVFALVVARSDGPQLKPSAVDCAAPRGRGAAPVPVPPNPNDRPLCGIRFLRGNIAAGGVTMAQFANALSRLAGRIVVDNTVLPGGFDLDLRWTPDPPPSGVVPNPQFPQPPVDPDGPSLFTAIQEQLGLKLEARNGPVDVIVIDHVERPTADDFEMVAPPPPPPPPPPPRDLR